MKYSVFGGEIVYNIAQTMVFYNLKKSIKTISKKICIENK